MRDIAITTGGDLIATSYGDIAIVGSDNDDIIQSANNNILTILGENIFHPEIGNDAYNKRLKLTESGLIEVETYSKDAILRDVRVYDVTSINASIGTGYGECVIEYVLLTTGGDTIDGRVSTNIF